MNSATLLLTSNLQPPTSFCGGCGEVVNAPDCGSGTRGFKSHQPPHNNTSRHCLIIGASPSGKATDSDSVMRRFESCRPSQYEPLAQSAEHLTFNQGVPRSSRGWLTILETRSWKLEARIGITLLFYNLASSFKPQASKCGSGGIGRRTRLRIWRVKPWGFKSLLPHQTCGSGSVVEHRLAKARVASSNLVFRSISNLIDLD